MRRRPLSRRRLLLFHVLVLTLLLTVSVLADVTPSPKPKPSGTTTTRQGEGEGEGEEGESVDPLLTSTVDLPSFVVSSDADREPVPKDPVPPKDHNRVGERVNVVPVAPRVHVVSNAEKRRNKGEQEKTVKESSEPQISTPYDKGYDTQSVDRRAAPLDSSESCPMQPRWLHAAAYLYGSVYVFGGISTISVPNSVNIHNDIWTFGPSTQAWDLYEPDQDPCPWPPPEPNPKPSQLYRPDSAPRAPVFNDSVPMRDRSPFIPHHPLSPIAVSTLPFLSSGQSTSTSKKSSTPKKKSSTPKKTSTKTKKKGTTTPSNFLELSVRERHRALGLAEPSYFEPFKSVGMPLDDLWQYDLSSRKWSQPASPNPNEDSDSDSETDGSGSGSNSAKSSENSNSSPKQQQQQQNFRFRSLRRTRDDGTHLLSSNHKHARRRHPKHPHNIDQPRFLEQQQQLQTQQLQQASLLPLTDHAPDPDTAPVRMLRVVGPSARWLHTMVTMNNKLVVFGGVTHDYALRDDVWEYDPALPAWTCTYAGLSGLSLADSIGLQQIPPEAIAAVHDPAQINISPREGHSAVVVKSAGFGSPATASSPSVMLVYGGLSGGSLSPVDSGVWAYSMATKKAMWTWSLSAANKVKQVRRPPSRWLHSASSIECAKPPCMVIFGGCSVNLVPLNDVWLFSVASNTWTHLQPAGVQLPPGRWLHSMVGIRAPLLSAVGATIDSLQKYDLHDGIQDMIDAKRQEMEEREGADTTRKEGEEGATKTTTKPGPKSRTSQQGEGERFAAGGLGSGSGGAKKDVTPEAYGVPIAVPTAMLVYAGAADQHRYFSDMWLLKVVDPSAKPKSTTTTSKPSSSSTKTAKTTKGSNLRFQSEGEERESASAGPTKTKGAGGAGAGGTLVCVWEKINTVSDTPMPREGHAAVVVEVSGDPTSTKPTPLSTVESPMPNAGAQWMMSIGGFSGSAEDEATVVPSFTQVAPGAQTETQDVGGNDV